MPVKSPHISDASRDMGVLYIERFYISWIENISSKGMALPSVNSICRL